MSNEKLTKYIIYKLERLEDNTYINKTMYGIGYKEGKINGYKEILDLIKEIK